MGILLVDVHGRVVMANPAAGRIFGLSQAEMRNMAMVDLGAATPAEDTSLFLQLVRGEREKYRLERSYARKDGSSVWTSVTVSLIRNAQGEPEYALTLVEDISERRDAEENSRRLLLEQTARAEAEAARRRIAFLAEASVALASSLDPNRTLDKLVRLAVPILGDYCLVDVQEPDGTVRRVTEAAADPINEERLQQLSRVPQRPNRSGPVAEVLRSAKTRLIASIDGHPLSGSDNPDGLDRIGGGARPVSVLLVPLVAGAQTLGAITFGTTQKERAYSEADVALAEEFARRAAVAIENARLYQDAKEASRLKDDFLAVVSHELRTPLMPILGWSQMMRETKVNKDTLAQGLETIERNARSQSRLIDDLLDVSRIIAGKLRLDVKSLALGPTIEDAIESVRPAAKAKSIRLICDLEASAPRVMGDPTRLQQIVWNLVSNAIKFTPSGGQVEIELVGGKDKVTLAVTDTGEGIRSDFLPHLFQRFRQAEAAATRKHGGLGLGLSIVRHLVELHGGTVSAHSPGIGMGSVFTVVLPAAREDDTRPASHAGVEPEVRQPSDEQPLPDLSGVSILVVEDQPDTLALLSRLLTGLGARVTGVSTTPEALAALKTEVPDLLISDLGLPGEDGYTLIERIRALPPAVGGRLPAIALTAFARTEDRVKALRSGFQTHVAKPVEPAELAEVIASLTKAKPVKPKRKAASRPKRKRK